MDFNVPEMGKMQEYLRSTESRLEAFHESRKSTNLLVIGGLGHLSRGHGFCANLLLNRDGVEKVKSASILLGFPDLTFFQSLGKS